MRVITKAELIQSLQDIAAMGWIKNGRPGNHGGIGNTLEDLLGIPENNLPLPDAADWELKTQSLHTKSLTTLFHCEPSPITLKFVPAILLPNYGWLHQEAGQKYPRGEMSFRQTINGLARSDRGFKVVVDRTLQQVLVSFDAASVSSRHAEWLRNVQKKIGLGELSPQPYWDFTALKRKIDAKLNNCFFVQASVKRQAGIDYCRFERAMMLEELDFVGFLKCLEDGIILVDFDARTGHNHGTKFRIRQNSWPLLYKQKQIIL